MFYLVLITDKLLCLTDNKYLPLEFKTNMTSVKVFDDYHEAEKYIHSRLTFDDIWDFGIATSKFGIEIGRIYRRS